MSGRWTESEIAAWLDGELGAEDAARIARLLETDPEAEALAERLRRNDALLREAFAAPLAEPAPGRLCAALADDAPEGGTVVRLAERRRPTLRAGALAAMAASLALIVGLGAGWRLGPGGGDGGAGAPGLLAAGPAPASLAETLETAPSGEALAGIRPLASFETAEAGLCREFETLDAAGSAAGVGLACRGAEGAWRVLVAAALEAPEDDGGAGGFAPASGAAVDVAGPFLDALGAGPALTPAEERDALARGGAR